MTAERRVAITGLGVISPFGVGMEPLWDGLMNEQSALKTIEAFDASGLQSRIGGEVPGMKTANFIPKTYRKSVKVMARDIEIAVAAAYEAVRDAGLKTKCLVDRGDVEGPVDVDSTKFGANIGAGLICADLNELAGALATAVESGKFDIGKWGKEMENLTPLWLLKFLPNMLGCHVTIVHDAQAPSNTITCGEASSHLAIGEGYRTISRGFADVCICGGAESKINPMGVLRQQLLGRLATGSDEQPDKACRPFAGNRNGIVVSEGGGLVILESLDRAKARNARIYGEIVGFGASANTTDWRKPDPEGAGLASAIRHSLESAGITADDVDLAGTFGLGTRDHDASEMNAFSTALGARSKGLPAMAIKGAVGNNGAGSGAIDFAATAKAVFEGVVPPSINTGDLDPACPLTFGKQDLAVRHAVSVAFAMGGGQNASLVIRKYEE